MSWEAVSKNKVENFVRKVEIQGLKEKIHVSRQEVRDVGQIIDNVVLSIEIFKVVQKEKV